MIWETLIRSYRGSKKKDVFSCGDPGLIHELDFLKGGSILNIQRLEKGERIFSGKERSLSKGTKARGAKKSWGSVQWDQMVHREERKEGEKDRVRAESTGIQGHRRFRMLFIRKRRITDVSAEVLRYYTGRLWQLIRCWEGGDDEGERLWQMLSLSF